MRLELRYVERYKERKQYECLEEIHKEEIIDHLAKLVVSDEKDEAAISFDVLMYGLMLSVMTGGKNLGRQSPILTFILLMIAGTEEGSTTFVSACLRFPCSVYISLIFS